jgi:hypothetical protein
MPRRKSNAGRWRCLTTGCNPVLNAASASAHSADTGHRVAAWPVRFPEGERRARVRNRTGYYDQYNVGAKDRLVRFGAADRDDWDDGSEEATYFGDSTGGA